MNDWKDLDLETPLKVIYGNNCVVGEFIDGEYIGDIYIESVRNNTKDYLHGDHKYRIKPLESIRITEDIVSRLEDSYCERLSVERLERIYNRKVEIIGE